MTTFEHGKAPAWACATWKHDASRVRTVAVRQSGRAPIVVASYYADTLCRALSLAKLAEDWARTENAGEICRDLGAAVPTGIISRARSALLKACAE